MRTRRGGELKGEIGQAECMGRMVTMALVVGGIAIFAVASWAGGASRALQAKTAAQPHAQQSASTSATAASSASAATNSPVAIPTNLEYEVASFKLNKEGGGSSSWSNGGDSLTARNLSLQSLVLGAYGIRNFQLSGAPSWLDSEHYDVDAKMDEATADTLKKLSQDEREVALQHMMQNLFEDRLKLKVRHETKELPVYFLVIGKNGSKLKDAKPDEKPSTHTNGRGAIFTTNAQGAQISYLVRMLSATLGRTVVDKTGLTGKYDFDLNWTSDERVQMATGSDTVLTTDPAGPSIMTALQEQLGLKLESGKGPVEIVVIERVERPTDN